MDKLVRFGPDSLGKALDVGHLHLMPMVNLSVAKGSKIGSVDLEGLRSPG